jgi:hypothetical protein
MIRIHSLGAAWIDIGSTQVTPIASKRFGLLLLLAADPGRRLPRSVLQSFLFPGRKDAGHSLREMVYGLRRSGVEFDSDSYGIGIRADDVRTDWRDMLATPLDDNALQQLEGGFLPGYVAGLSEDFSEWYDGFRAKTIFELTKAVLNIVDTAKRGGKWFGAERAARACLALDPFNEHATLALAEMLAIRGCATQALRLLDECHLTSGPNASILSKSIRRLRGQISEKATQYRRTEQLTFCGRDSEMGLVSDALAAVQHTGVRAVLFTGVPGVGKTRILAEFELRVGLENAVLLRASAHPRDEVMPLGVISGIVRSLLTQPGALGCSPNSMKWLNRLLEPPRDSDDTLPSEETAFAIARAVVDLTTAVSAEAPLVLVLDDAQWADDASLRLLNTIALSRQSTRIVIIFAARDGQRVFDAGDWHDILTSRDVSPLPRTSTLELLAHELASTAADAELLDWMFDTSGGNPFFLDCLVHHYRSTAERFTVPSKLNALVDQRIAALTADARDVLEAIVALGRRATPSRIEQLLDMPSGLLFRMVRELEARRLISANHGTISASHWLVAESVQRNSSPIAQQFLYRRMAVMLEAELSLSRDSRELWECAEAWIAAAEPERAASVIASCGERCLAIGRTHDAATLFLRAANLVQGERRQRLAEQSVGSASRTSESRLVLSALALIDGRRSRGHDDLELAGLMAKLAHDADAGPVVAALADCLSCVSAALEHRLSAAFGLLVSCDQRRDVTTVLKVREQVLELLSTRDDEHQGLQLQCALVFHATFGDLRLVPDISEQLVQIAREARPDIAADLMRKAATGLHRCGESGRSLSVFEDCYRIATDAGLERLADGVAIRLAGQYLDAGRPGDSDRWYGVVNAADPALRDHYLQFAFLTTAAEIEFFRGNISRLEELAANSLALALDKSPAIQRFHATLRYAIAHLCGDRLQSELVVHDLTSHHSPGCEVGDYGDFEIAIASCVLARDASAQAAAALIDSYLRKVRRPGTPVSVTLLKVMHSVGISAGHWSGTRGGASSLSLLSPYQETFGVDPISWTPHSL